MPLRSLWRVIWISFLERKLSAFIQASLKNISKGQIVNKPSLVQSTVSHRIGEEPFLNQWWLIALTRISVISHFFYNGRHYNDVIMSAMASQITSLTIVHSIVYSGTDQRKHQISASLSFVRGIHRWPVNSPHKGPVTRKMLPFDGVIMFKQNRLRD